MFVFFTHLKYKKKKIGGGLSGGASRWMLCYQRGLPHLVFYMTLNYQFIKKGLVWHGVFGAP